MTTTDPWATTNVAALRLPNVFTDVDGNPVTVTTDPDRQTIQIGDHRFDPVEAANLAEYLAKASAELHNDALDRIPSEDDQRKRPTCPLHDNPGLDMSTGCTCDS
ncbi:hypothetical protein ABZ755_15410 [Streptomyces griseoincarnatus]